MLVLEPGDLGCRVVLHIPSGVAPCTECGERGLDLGRVDVEPGLLHFLNDDILAGLGVDVCLVHRDLISFAYLGGGEVQPLQNPTVLARCVLGADRDRRKFTRWLNRIAGVILGWIESITEWDNLTLVIAGDRVG